MLALGAAVLSGAAESRGEAREEAVARLVAQANAAAREDRLADSRDLWRAVWQLDRSQVAACNIGALSLRLGDAPGAVRWLSVCKEIMRAPRTPEERALHASRLSDLARARQLTGEIHVIAPAGAAIAIDGAPVQVEGERPIPVAPGRHLVRAVLDGQIATAEVDVPRGEAREVVLTFPAPGAGAGPEDAPAGAGLRAGPTAERPEAAERAAVPTHAPSRPRPRPDLVAGGFGLSAALATVGGVMLLGAERKDEAGRSYAVAAGANGCFRLSRPMCRESASAYDDARLFRSVGIAGLITGGAVLAATLGYTFYPRGSAEIAVSASGVTVTGRF
ncbi:hypothetical protein SOCEGT47_043750 [Sorangium cellulosum]|uniref:PEGA domain-containing protein n=1 Tax=Sorangium cellulosum TaxID=56 RepID=A0A4P2Q3E3_SORCE|nr:hypothetical protein [Sorangium cellulosum]AUX23845.1 hypothetical protein SOCEGT47_043750 [Sorangium cellulosum]